MEKQNQKLLWLPEPTEEAEQILLFQWAELFAIKRTELRLLLHIPNGGKRGKAEAGRFKAMGVKSGVPDIFLPVPRGGLHGLWIELKRRRSGKLSDSQRSWLVTLKKQGYAAYLCHGWEDSSKVILAYLDERLADKTSIGGHG